MRAQLALIRLIYECGANENDKLDSIDTFRIFQSHFILFFSIKFMFR